MHIVISNKYNIGPTTSGPSDLAGRFGCHVGEAIAGGLLPPATEVALAVQDDGLFRSLMVTVTECPALVIDCAWDVRINGDLRANAAGGAITRALAEIAREVAPDLPAAVIFSRDLMRRQLLWVKKDPAAVMAPLWQPRPGSAKRGAVAPIIALADALAVKLAGGIQVSADNLFAMATEAFGATQAAAGWTAKEAYEAAELAFSKHVLSMAEVWRLDVSPQDAAATAVEIERAALLLPTQTRRDLESEALQQFSTPHALGYCASWAANITADDTVFEPSAGTGCLAVFGSLAGAKAVHVNEISERRLAALRALGYEPTAENAEQVHNIFAGKIAPTVVLMNPPFSRSVRMGNRVQSGAAGQHVEAALDLLVDGGRLVAIVGRRVSKWLDPFAQRYRLRANILLAGSLFQRHGTSVETRLLVIEKAAPDGDAVTGHAGNVEDLIGLLAPLLHSRPGQASSSDDGQPGGGDSRYAPYMPRALVAARCKPHPGTLVESHAMAAIDRPPLHYVPTLPSHVLDMGLLSAAQYETVAEAGQAHEQWITGEGGRLFRKGYYIGCSTGVGKGRMAAGIILDNWKQGRRRHLWISKDDTKLLKAAKRDWLALGGDPSDVFSLRSFQLGETISRDEGILMVSFGALRSERDLGRRLDQILEWCGPDFDGCILFDEAHKMGNNMEVKSERGTSSASQTALAGEELQDSAPLARVVYLSATGASEARNIGYMSRLGFWGPEAPFRNKAECVHVLEMGGVAALEVFARDAKATGVMCARSLSYSDVRYERLVHELTAEQVAIYDKLAEAWAYVLSNLDAAMEAAGSRKNGKARSAALSQFWGTNQRFFKQVLTSLQMPSVIDAIERDLAAGHAAVVQLVSTLEAAQDRALAQQGALNDLENLDLTPREILMQYLENCWPTAAYEEYQDSEGRTRTRIVHDSQGNVVRCRQAEAMRDRLLTELGSIAVPDGPLELLLDKFGVDKVAEITGRSRRVVYLRDPETGELRRQVQPRSEGARLADMQAFCDDEKSIVVFSNAANTGIDLNASLSFKNQRLRRHYILDPGFSAKECVQGLGRTHRTYQKQAPVYILVATNLKGQLRFLSTIARRLDELGALTRGQRDTGSQGLFSSRDNVDSSYGAAAVRLLVQDLARGECVAGMTVAEFETKMGLRLLDDDGNLVESRIPPVRQFLNRMLALPVADNNKMFAEFAERMDELIQRAVDAGTYAQGVEFYQAERIEEIAAPRVVYRDAGSGAKTYYVHLRAWHHRQARRFLELGARYVDGSERQIVGWVKSNDGSGGVHAVATARTITNDAGEVVRQVRLIGPYAQAFVPARDVECGTAFEQLDHETALAAWEKEIEENPEWRSVELHLLTGVLLPIWNRVQGASRVYRVVTEAGTAHLGRLIAPGMLRQTLAQLGTDLDEPWTGEEVVRSVMAGGKVCLANGWELARARINREDRVEVKGFKFHHLDRLKELGLMIEMIAWKTRAFLPTSRDDIASKLISLYPPVPDGAAEMRVAA